MAITPKTEVGDLPPIEYKQFVSRKTTAPTQLSSKHSEKRIDSHVSETEEQEQALVREVQQNQASSENVMEEVRVTESSEIKHESTEQQHIVSKSESTANADIQTGETLVDEIMEAQEGESAFTTEHQKQETTNENVDSKCDEEKSTNIAETDSQSNLKNTEAKIALQHETSNKSIEQEICITKSSDMKQEKNASFRKKTTQKQKAKILSQVNITRKTASDELEDPLITKLDKKIDKELRIIQGNSNDDDKDDINDDTLNDLLYGQRAKELNEFLNN